jgi:hypothetical protein
MIVEQKSSEFGSIQQPVYKAGGIAHLIAMRPSSSVMEERELRWQIRNVLFWARHGGIYL